MSELYRVVSRMIVLLVRFVVIENYDDQLLIYEDMFTCCSTELAVT